MLYQRGFNTEAEWGRLRESGRMEEMHGSKDRYGIWKWESINLTLEGMKATGALYFIIDKRKELIEKVCGVFRKELVTS